MLPWFQNDAFPLYLAPMAGVTDLIFRRICKELGADVMVTEFVSAEGIMQADERTRIYTEFDDEQRPVGVQLFGADGPRMAEAAKKIIDWKQPDFIDINFGCPVKKVVSKNGGSSLLRDCPVLAEVASSIAKGVGDQVPVTAKIRIGWDQNLINAPEVCHILEDCGMQAIAVHGRTRAQGYSGEADWNVIDQCSRSVSIPVIGNGDITSGADVQLRRESTGVSGIMIGRSAMQYPWIFRDAKRYLETGEEPEPVSPEERWSLILRHAALLIQWGKFPTERHAMQALRSRLMAYSKGLRHGKLLRCRFSTINSLSELEAVAGDYLDGTLEGVDEMALSV
ncbi:MAG: tRNA dihydrouridine synthase DusB [Verrucomicrobiales bacterium]|nr:tRNA dihydrouridine synthase DusB [Verrucomicrobiales bacterium]MBP9226110.1 tRNA dihydrouridine synthase DusB [Verrucomicrobiales bacterium]